MLTPSKNKPISCIQIELTNHCNYKCHFCPQSIYKDPRHSESPFDRPKGYMDFDLFKQVVKEAYEISRSINFSFFGEQLLHPDFLKFMDVLKSRPPDVKIVMNTNLSLATGEFFAKLIDIEIDHFRISIDAATPETYDLVRPGKYYLDLDGNRLKGNRFEAIMNKIRYWFGLNDHRPTRHVFTVSSINRKEVDQYVERWKPLLGETDEILLKTVLTYGGKMKDALNLENPCDVWESDFLTVDWRGRVSPCNLDTNMELELGSFPERSLLELHLSEQRKKLSERSKAREIVPCKFCIDANNIDDNIIVTKNSEYTYGSISGRP